MGLLVSWQQGELEAEAPTSVDAEAPMGEYSTLYDRCVPELGSEPACQGESWIEIW